MLNFTDYPNMTKAYIPENVLVTNNDFSNRYKNMQNLINGNTPPCVRNMYYTYLNCTNLTGSPVCGDNVTNMGSTYHSCTNLTGSPVCGPNVTDMNGTYLYCTNLHGNMYMYSSHVSNVAGCFGGRNIFNILNIYVLKDSRSFNTIINGTSYSNSITDKPITWTNNAGTCYYNTTENIYIYPVNSIDDIESLYVKDSLIDFEYTKDETTGIYQITSWKGTLNGVPSTEIVIPDSNKIMI